MRCDGIILVCLQPRSSEHLTMTRLVFLAALALTSVAAASENSEKQETAIDFVLYYYKSNSPFYFQLTLSSVPSQILSSTLHLYSPRSYSLHLHSPRSYSLLLHVRHTESCPISESQIFTKSRVTGTSFPYLKESLKQAQSKAVLHLYLLNNFHRFIVNQLLRRKCKRGLWQEKEGH